MKILAHIQDEKSQGLLKLAAQETQNECDFIDSLDDVASDNYQLIVIEMMLENIHSMNWIESIRLHHPETPIALITEQTLQPESIEKLNAFNILGYLQIPPTLSDLKGVLLKVGS